MSSNVIDLYPRLFRRPAVQTPGSPREPAVSETVGYEVAAIHEGVPVTVLVAALARHGLTLSNVRGHGLVIHRIGQDPRRAARPGPLGAS